jgi:hypothetical protein
LEADFGLEMSVMLLDVTLCDSIVKPVTTNLTENSGDNWRKVKETDLLGSKVVEGSEEYCESCVDADYPGKREAIVDDRKEDRRLDEYADGAHTGLPKAVAKVARAVLRDADELLELGTSRWLIDRVDRAVVICLFYEQDCQDQDESILPELANSLTLRAL